ncbi:MAG: bifunctional DNA primase/polymerase [Sedimentisphaerales bacterium]
MIRLTESQTLKSALRYHRRGWCVIPIPHGQKVAQVRWKQYQTERPDANQLNKWFGDNHSNIAVVLGNVSGGLACRDFDEEKAYQQWAGEHQNLADKLPTVKTARGYHVYFRADVSSVRHFDDGELRGNGGYCLLPPSLHPDGAIYKWLIEPNGENLLFLDPFTEGLAQSVGNVTEKTEQAENTEQTQKTEKTKDIEKILIVYIKDFEKIIRETLPKKIGTRNRRVFEFARALRSMPEYFDADPKIFKLVVREWHKQALPNIKTKDFVETWIDFLKAWPKIKWTLKDNPVGETFEKAKKASVPNCATKYDNPKLRLLVKWCKILQEKAGNASFFLSARTAGKFLKTDPMTAYRWLFLLVSDDVLKVVEKGKLTRTGGIATRFRYVAD